MFNSICILQTLYISFTYQVSVRYERVYTKKVPNEKCSKILTILDILIHI